MVGVLILAAASIMPGLPAAASEMGVMSGHVRGFPAAGWDSSAVVTAFNVPTGEPFTTTIDPVDGAYSLNLPVGDYKVFLDYTGSGNYLDRWSGGGGEAQAWSIYTVTTTPRTNDLVAFGGGSISGTVTGSAPLPLAPQVSVQRVGMASTTIPRVTVDSATGTYTVDRLDPGTYRLRYSGGPNWVSEWWDGKASATAATLIATEFGTTLTGFDVDLQPTSSISGHVEVAESTMVTLYRDGVLANLAYVTDANGDYVFGHLNPGTYTVRFGSGYRSKWQTLWWESSRRQHAATPIVITTPVAITGIDAVVEAMPSLRGTVTAPSFGGDLGSYSGTAQLLREDPQGSGNFVLYESADLEYGGGVPFSFLEPGRYRLRVLGSNESLIRTTYWPGVTDPAEAGDFVVNDSTSTDFDASFVMVGRSVDVVERLAGANRFATAVEATRFGFPSNATPIPVVYIANGLNYPDALSAGPAAVHQGGALLMVAPDHIPTLVMEELRRLDPQKIVITGGSASVSDGVAAALRDEFGSDVVQRIAGADRFETSRLIAEYAFEDADHALVATGLNFPDALVAGPAAASVDAPVILVNGSSPDLDSGTADLLQSLGVQETYVIGSSLSVSFGIEQDLAALSDSGVTRLAGPNRYSTALAIVREFFEESPTAFLATGANFPDALGGGALAGALEAPLYITPPQCLLDSVYYDLFYLDVRELYILGSDASVSSAVEVPVLCG